MAERPPIPNDKMREVRQRCGFGCVICGLPIFEYDHIHGWENDPNTLTLLCDNHHKLKTNGLIPIAQIVEADANPFQSPSGPDRKRETMVRRYKRGDRCRVQ